MPQTTALSDTISKTAVASIVIAFVVMLIKYVAYHVTGSVALYSDALESIVNVLTGIVAFVAVRVSAEPPDKQHPFGHHKAEFFSAILEGALIIAAALAILHAAWPVLLNPKPIAQPGVGVVINGTASLLNGLWAYFLISRGRAWRSPALTADGWHLFSDVVTSVGVIAGLILSTITGWAILDPLLAIVVAVNVLWTGARITAQSMSHLLDEAASPEIEASIRDVIRENGNGALQAHDIRTRHAGRAIFIEFHLVVPALMTVAEAHEICDRIEHAIEARIEGTEVVIHVEPEDKAKTKGAVEL
jgi:cation diffusion facilitator family transporter